MPHSNFDDELYFDPTGRDLGVGGPLVVDHTDTARIVIVAHVSQRQGNGQGAACAHQGEVPKPWNGRWWMDTQAIGGSFKDGPARASGIQLEYAQNGTVKVYAWNETVTLELK